MKRRERIKTAWTGRAWHMNAVVLDDMIMELRALWAVLEAAKGILPRTIALQRALNAYYAGQREDEE